MNKVSFNKYIRNVLTFINNVSRGGARKQKPKKMHGGNFNEKSYNNDIIILNESSDENDAFCKSVKLEQRIIDELIKLEEEQELEQAREQERELQQVQYPNQEEDFQEQNQDPNQEEDFQEQNQDPNKKKEDFQEEDPQEYNQEEDFQEEDPQDPINQAEPLLQGGAPSRNFLTLKGSKRQRKVYIDKPTRKKYIRFEGDRVWLSDIRGLYRYVVDKVVYTKKNNVPRYSETKTKKLTKNVKHVGKRGQ